MKSIHTEIKAKENKQVLVSALLSLSLATASCLSMQQAYAQEDSLLPPEVVPLEPGAASNMQLAQTQARAASMQAAGGMQTAQQARQTAFDSLMNQGEMPPQLKGAPFTAVNTGSSSMLASNSEPANTQSQTLSGQVKSTNLKGQDAVHKGTPLAKGLMAAAGIGMFAMSMAMMFRSYGGSGNRTYTAPFFPAPGYSLPRIGSGYVYPSYLVSKHLGIR